MHPNELKEFRDNIALPRIMELFEKTLLSEGTCYIDNLEISFCDGRSWGFDSRIFATGLIYRNGKAEHYAYGECDVPLEEFFAKHKDCVFISDGTLHVIDELEEMALETRIRNIQSVERFFHWFESPKDFKQEMSSIEYEKLKYMFSSQDQPARANPKPSFETRISDAEKRASDTRSDLSRNVREEEPIF